jgi:hypothetical protein
LKLNSQSSSSRTAVAASVLLAAASAASLDATAAPREKVLFENQHIRFVEVTRWPGEKGAVAAEPYAAVIAVDAAWPSITEQPLAANESFGSRGMPPSQQAYPWCQAHTPLTAREVTVTGEFPQHFYRFEYKRIDGEKFTANWKSWYPWMLHTPPMKKDLGTTPQPGAPYSRQWPFPLAYNAVQAAPANHYVRYEDAHIQLVEVVVRPGETENMHGHPYSSVYSNDGAGPTDPVPAGQVNKTLVPDTPPPWGEKGQAVSGSSFPSCLAAVPEGPHHVYNPKDVPEHFYRLHFLRIDGEDIRTRWREWYPSTNGNSSN